MKTSNLIPLLLLIICFCFFSCDHSNKKKQTTIPLPADSSRFVDRTISISPFTSSPETDSCACFFSVDSVTYHHRSYIFAYNLSTIAYMKINGEMITFSQTEYITIGKNSVTKFTASPYTMYLELSDVEETGKEATLQWGSIRVMDSKGNAAITPFFGGCRCRKPS